MVSTRPGNAVGGGQTSYSIAVDTDEISSKKRGILLHQENEAKSVQIPLFTLTFKHPRTGFLLLV